MKHMKYARLGNYFEKYFLNIIQVFKYLSSPMHRRKKDRFLPHFGQNATFEFSKYESFVIFIMPKHSSDGNFRPFCAFIEFSEDV